MKTNVKLILAFIVGVLCAGALIYGLPQLGGDGDEYTMDDFLAGRVDARSPPAMANAGGMTPSQPTPGAAGQAPQLQSVDAMVEGLRRRLERDGDDLEGWLLLARSYDHLQQWQAAATAWEKARDLGYDGAWRPRPGLDAFTDAAPAPTAAAGQAEIRVRVSLDGSLAGKVPASAPLFVFARNSEGGGPPLAVLRRSAGELPLEVTLRDADAMLAGNNLSSASRVVIGARISVSGSASAQPGDFERLSEPLSPRSPGGVVDLVID